MSKGIPNRRFELTTKISSGLNRRMDVDVIFAQAKIVCSCLFVVRTDEIKVDVRFVPNNIVRQTAAEDGS